MVEPNSPQSPNPTDSDGGWSAPVSPFDAASYIFQMSREMAGLAGGAGLAKIAAALELARDLAAEAMAAQSRSRD